MTLPGGSTIEVSHLQTKKWADLTAPEDTKILRDLVQVTRQQAKVSQPVVVHCSAGVGRTGTFIAVYKLIEEYLDRYNYNCASNIYKTLLLNFSVR